MNLWLWDVQHGSAAYLETPTGRHVVVDLGVGDTSTGDATFSPLTHLRRSGVERLDQVIITHPHRDHLDDIFEFDSLSPRMLMRPNHLTEAQIRAGNRAHDGSVINEYLEISARYSEPVADHEHPLRTQNAGMETQTFHPCACPTTNLNNHSIISFFTYAGSTVCLPGDNESPSWRELLSDPAFCRMLRQTDVLVAAHHGREAGYCEDIFEYCNPCLICVSDGPGCDTSAVDKYCDKATGWTVHSRSGSQPEDRYVLTTRTDGSINISAGFEDNQKFLQVTVE